MTKLTFGRTSKAIAAVLFIAMAHWSCSCPDGPAVSLPIELSGSGRLSLGLSIDSLENVRKLVEGDYMHHTYSEIVDSPLVNTILYEECSSRVMRLSAFGDNLDQSVRDSVVGVCRRTFGSPRNSDSLGSSPLTRRYGWNIGDEVYAELVIYPRPRDSSYKVPIYSYVLVLMYRGFESEPPM